MDQLSVFDLLCENKPLPNNIKLLSLFSGIGAFEKALDNLCISYELVGYCEIDKYASKSYSAIHGVSEDKNLWDVTKVDEKALPKDIDLITYGFPCQDISLAGKQKGLFNEDGTKTRSGLFFDALRIIEETQPKVAIAENVKNLVGKKFSDQFKIVLDSLESAGYNNYYQVLNAKDFGIPQNRERVFIISIRKDIDNGYTFPKGFPLEKRLKDVLEDTVDEKYYLDGKFEYITKINENYSIMNGGSIGKMHDISRRAYSEQATAPTIPTCAGGNIQPKVIIEDFYKNRDERIYEEVAPTLGSDRSGLKVAEPRVIGGIGEKKSNGGRQWYQQDRVYDDGVAISVTTSFQPYYATQEPIISIDEDSVKVRVANKKGYDEAVEGDSINLEQPNSKTRRGRVGKAVAQTLTTSPQQAVVEPIIQRIDIPQTVKVRKYPVNCELLCECLRDYKHKSNFSNKEIAKALNLPITKVEHWFRQDDCFSIPDADIWLDLKMLLGIETNEFDESIMTFEEKEGAFEKSERHYLSEGVAPTITSTTAAEKVIEPSLRIRKLTPKECFRLMGFDDADFHKAEAVNSNTQLYKQAGNSIVVDVLYYLLKELYENL